MSAAAAFAASSAVGIGVSARLFQVRLAGLRTCCELRFASSYFSS